MVEEGREGTGPIKILITDRIAREGILYACVATDLSCLQAARTYATTQTTQSFLTFQNTFWGLRGPVIEIVLIMTPPRKK